MLRTLFALLALGLSLPLAAQQPGYIIQGRILDENSIPLPGASIVDRNSQLGTISDSRGYFTLTLQEIPIFLEVSFIGYATFYESFTDDELALADSVFLEVQMSTVAELLDEAVVTGEYQEEFYNVRTVQVLDFTFMNDKILLLLKEKSQLSLALINEYGDSIASLDVDFKAQAFIKDCLDHIYVVGRDSVFGLSFGKDQIHNIGGIHSPWYEEMVAPCIAANGNNLYYQFYGSKNQIVSYFQTAYGEKESKLLRTVGDMSEVYSMQEYMADARMWQSRGNAKKAYEMMAWHDKILMRPAFHPLYATTEGAVIFDHFKDSVLVLNDQGQLVDRHHVQHHRDKDFNEMILQDAVSGKFYVYYLKQGEVMLTELSEDQFLPENSVKIQDVVFPQSLKIRNGITYYLDHLQEDYERLKLYRQKL